MIKSQINSSFFLQVIDKLPHSRSRVPYTYHHDYLIYNSKFHQNMSRSDVAKSNEKDSDLQLYAVALVQLLDELGSKAIYHLSWTDIIVCKKAKEITDQLVLDYNN